MPCLVPRPRLCSPRHSRSLRQRTSHPSSRDSGAGQQGTAELQVTGPVPARNRGLPQVPGSRSKPPVHTHVAWGAFEIRGTQVPPLRIQFLRLWGRLAGCTFTPVIQWAARVASHCPKAPSSCLRLTSHYILPLRLGQLGAIFLPMDRICAGRQHISPGTGALPANTGSDLCSGSGGVCPGVRREPGPGDRSAFRAPSLRAEGVRVASLAVHRQAHTTLRAHTLSYLLPITWARLRLSPRPTAWARSVPGAEPCEWR